MKPAADQPSVASNKNQHFVPRCYLRAFTIDGGNSAINLFNVDRGKCIEYAPIKHQCSRDYFYGENKALEEALQFMEGSYASVLRAVVSTKYTLNSKDSLLLKRFWLLQYMRTEAASIRAVTMTTAMTDAVGGVSHLRLGVREAVRNSLRHFVDRMDVIDDLKACLLRNRSAVPFFTSDDPAVLTNRWHLGTPRTRERSFGLQSAGNVILLPITPRILFLAYDKDVYATPHTGGWADLEHLPDVEALNEHQVLNCRANLFYRDTTHGNRVEEAFRKAVARRPNVRHRVNYAVLDQRDDAGSRYKVVDRDQAGDHEEALVHVQTIHPSPNAWPRQLRWRWKGVVFTNGTGLGYVRRAFAETHPAQSFWTEPVHHRS